MPRRRGPRRAVPSTPSPPGVDRPPRRPSPRGGTLGQRGRPRLPPSRARRAQPSSGRRAAPPRSSRTRAAARPPMAGRSGPLGRPAHPDDLASPPRGVGRGEAAQQFLLRSAARSPTVPAGAAPRRVAGRAAPGRGASRPPRPPRAPRSAPQPAPTLPAPGGYRATAGRAASRTSYSARATARRRRSRRSGRPALGQHRVRRSSSAGASAWKAATTARCARQGRHIGAPNSSRWRQRAGVETARRRPAPPAARGGRGALSPADWPRILPAGYAEHVGWWRSTRPSPLPQLPRCPGRRPGRRGGRDEGEPLDALRSPGQSAVGEEQAVVARPPPGAKRRKTG